MQILIKGVSQKGKQRLREWGTSCLIMRESETVLFSTESCRWLYILPVDVPTSNCREPQDGSRWIKAINDKDFKILLN